MTSSLPAAVPQMMKLQVNKFMFTVACDNDDDNDGDDGGNGTGDGDGSDESYSSNLTHFKLVQQ